MCSSCWSALPRLSNPMVAVETMELPLQAHFNRSFAVFEYSDAVQKLVHTMKYKGMSHLAARIGDQLAEACSSENATQGIDMLVPVPLHAVRFRERGYNQAELLARQVGTALDVELAHALRRVRNTNQQAKFSREQRQENVKDAFKLAKGADVDGKSIALVDDVLTTGSTLSECAKQLASAGAAEVLALTIVRI